MENAEQPPIPDGLDRPFCEAASQDRLILQYRPVDDCWQYPPSRHAAGCAARLAARSGGAQMAAGTSYSYAVVSGTPIASSQLDQPFNSAVIELDDFQSDPPGHPVGGFRSELR